MNKSSKEMLEQLGDIPLESHDLAFVLRLLCDSWKGLTPSDDARICYLYTKYISNINKSSMLYWWPKIKDLPIRQPKTEVVAFADISKIYAMLDGEGYPAELPQVRDICNRMGYPIFLRTDQTSAKHSWKETCFIPNEEALSKNLIRLIDTSIMLTDEPVSALFIREYIPMQTMFRAFHGNTPINPEIRFFIRDGKVECWHWYWQEDALENNNFPPKHSDWKWILRYNRDRIIPDCFTFENYAECGSLSNVINRLAELACQNTEKSKCISTFLNVAVGANMVAEQFKNDGYWSVDFCLEKDENEPDITHWVLIDMAEGEKSWHPECTYRRNES